MARSKRDYKKIRAARGFDEEDLIPDEADDESMETLLAENPLPDLPKDRPALKMSVSVQALKRQVLSRIAEGEFVPRFTRHARERCIERRIPESEIRYLLRTRKGRLCGLSANQHRRKTEPVYTMDGFVPSNRRGKLRLVVSPIEHDPKSLLIQTAMWLDEA